jgi:hypothetical protein
VGNPATVSSDSSFPPQAVNKTIKRIMAKNNFLMIPSQQTKYIKAQ